MTPTRGGVVRFAAGAAGTEVQSSGAAISEWGFKANGCTWEKGVENVELERKLKLDR